ncbi:dihydrofolate reductase [Coleophoma cylindrospora]|uniref:Dihydrofolate reductase n=1 Tax=Coleophoma cylindrospora TaxID=1849047 RepID=A0A3D8QCL8_9HELO|nr:dihydrofolate reductase [Coleophoma cylindrospora]
MALPKELALIVAATSKNMGIGKNGGLPWTGLRKEMQYFAQVTQTTKPGQANENAVIMGRKTWESIPKKFRPLKLRTNVIISRSHPESGGLAGVGNRSIQCNSIDGAMNAIGNQALETKGSESPKVFVIGGAQIYQAALDFKEAKFILLTRILEDFDCDTFFPLKLNADGSGDGWERQSYDFLKAWVGIDVPEGIQEENGIKYVFEMWQKTDTT